jgi:glycosyltransferase involved in cell wall biosynthesis
LSDSQRLAKDRALPNVLSVAYPLLPVSADSAGGAEQILYLLERELIRLGCQSTVVAAKGSRVHGRLMPTPTYDGEITEETRRNAQHIHLETIEHALASSRFDLIHFHGLDFNTYFPNRRIPKVATLHLPPSWYSSEAFCLPGLHLTCVSQSQAKLADARNRQLSVVLNGIDNETYTVGPRTRDHLLWLGRICPEKGVHLALEIAHALELPLLLAGPVHPFREHQQYYRDQVLPLLDNRRQYIGPVGLERKTDLLSRASALLIPSLAAETSSLVAMEAMSSGTPVIAFRSGALPEVIEDGVTGFVVNDLEEMKAAVLKVDETSATACRTRAVRYFSSRRMAEDYLDLYARVIDAWR